MKRETDMAKAEESKVHKLKTWPMFFQAVLEGSKPFELRKNDRHFNVGDILILEEYDPDAEGYTGRKCERKISYVLDANPFIDLHGHVILGLESRPAVLMPGEEDLKQYITNLLYKARDNGADVLNETSFDSWQEEQESRFCQRKR